MNCTLHLAAISMEVVALIGLIIPVVGMAHYTKTSRLDVYKACFRIGLPTVLVSIVAIIVIIVCDIFAM